MLIVTANCKNTFDSYLKYVHYTDSKRRKTRFSGATGWLLLACAAAVIVSFVKVGGNIFLYVVSAVLVLCAAAYLYIQYLAPYRAFKKLDKSFFAEQEFDFYEDKLELIEHGEKSIKRIIPYSKIQKVCITKHAFYIYIAADSAFILTKTALSSSSVERLRNLFKDKGIKTEE